MKGIEKRMLRSKKSKVWKNTVYNIKWKILSKTYGAPRKNDKHFIWHKQGIKSATDYRFFTSLMCVCLRSIYFNLAAYHVDVCSLASRIHTRIQNNILIIRMLLFFHAGGIELSLDVRARDSSSAHNWILYSFFFFVFC